MTNEEMGEFYADCVEGGMSGDDAAALIDGMIRQRAEQRKATQMRAATEAAATVIDRMYAVYTRELARA